MLVKMQGDIYFSLLLYEYEYLTRSPTKHKNMWRIQIFQPKMICKQKDIFMKILVRLVKYALLEESRIKQTLFIL